MISEQQNNITYRFVSDFPFKNRAPHELDDFERRALARLRADPHQVVTDVSWSIFSDRVRLIAPVVMGKACVNCHNSHPESPKRDWKVGDVRGIQEVIDHSADRRQHLLVQIPARSISRCMAVAGLASSACSTARRD